MSVGKAGAVKRRDHARRDRTSPTTTSGLVHRRSRHVPARHGGDRRSSNQDDVYSKLKIGGAVEIKVGDEQKSIYKGEIVGLEPSTRAARRRGS